MEESLFQSILNEEVEGEQFNGISKDEITKKVRKIVDRAIKDHYDEIVEGGHIFNASQPQIMSITFTRYRNVALKHLKELYEKKLAKRGVPMQFLITTFVAFVDAEILHKEFKPTLVQHYKALIHRSHEHMP